LCFLLDLSSNFQVSAIPLTCPFSNLYHTLNGGMNRRNLHEVTASQPPLAKQGGQRLKTSQTGAFQTSR
jgi:hypothetical protein